MSDRLTQAEAEQVGQATLDALTARPWSRRSSQDVAQVEQALHAEPEAQTKTLVRLALVHHVEASLPLRFQPHVRLSGPESLPPTRGHAENGERP